MTKEPMTNFLDTLTAIIADRKTNPKPGSYTNDLLANRTKAAQKVGEEAAEVLVAALAQSDQRLTEEMADLIYHSLVLLESRDIPWARVLDELQRRHSP
jgi:phosphoribosyl-ATP pyrophosphohydrolase